MQVWILAKGEDNEPDAVLGVYATRDAARSDFEAVARELDASCTIDRARVADNGAIYLHAGCDNLSLEPWTVQNGPVVAGKPAIGPALAALPAR